MNSTPPVLLIDDGELGDVRKLLDELRVDYRLIQGSKHKGPVPDAERVMITTSRLAIALNCRRTARPGAEGPVWIAFLHGESRTQRQVLERAGFDFMVRRPVHPAALRLLLLRALYRGDESRRTGRIAFGYEVGVKLGMRTHKATLTDLSPGGCRILLTRALDKRQKLTVRIPPDAAGGRRLDLPGTVVRISSGDEGGGLGDRAYGVRFDALARDVRDRLRDLLIDHATGPAVLREPVARNSRPVAVRGETRAHPRKTYDAKVTAIGGTARAETHHVLLGCDVSLGGMRIESDASLKLDDEIRLAIQPEGGSDPVLVEATVVRDDGDDGLALRFDWIDPQSEPRLSEVLDALPMIEDLHGSRGQTVLSRILSSFRKG